jgi:hypothetical protein
VLGEESQDQIQHTISDYVDQAMDEFSTFGEEREIVKQAVLSILRQSFYRSEPVEREYLSKLSRTYTLLFVLKNEPRIVEFLSAHEQQFCSLCRFRSFD